MLGKAVYIERGGSCSTGRKCSDAGFTLVEIMVVLALAAIMIIAGLVLFSNRLANAEVENRNVNFLLRTGALFSALRHDLDAAFSVDGGDESFRINFISFNDDEKKPEYVEALYSFDREKKIFTRTFRGRTITYDFSKDIDSSETLDFKIETGKVVKMSLVLNEKNGKKNNYCFTMHLKNFCMIK